MFFKLIKSYWFIALSFFLIFFWLIYLAYQQPWKYHLEMDVWGFYYPRLLHFLDNLSFAGIGENEYFPGAMFFFLIPGFIFLFSNNTWQIYVIGLFVVNMFLVLLHLYIYRQHNILAPFIFLGILLFAGPIILYRHDLFVSLIVLLSILAWKSERRSLSMFVLGLATSVKIYPLLIFPYFLLIIIKRKSLKEVLKITSFFSFGILSIFGIYLLLGSSTSEVIEPMYVNSIKPVHVESIWGSILTVLNCVGDGYWPVGRGEHGIFGIAQQDIFLPLNFYNYFWIIPLAIFYIFLSTKKTLLKSLNIEVIFLTILLFVIFSKIITPQYLFWFIPLFSLFSWQKERVYSLLGSFVVILAVVLLTQYLYPLHYNELLGIFYTSGAQVHLFYLLLLRNILLVILFILIFRFVFLSHNFFQNEKHI